MMSRFFLWGFVFFLAIPHGWAVNVPSEALQKTLGYLNGLRQFQTPFVQWDEWGGEKSGMLYVKRPGLFRADYDVPFKDRIIIERGEAFFHDDEARSHYRFSADASTIPLLSLLDDVITWRGDYVIDSFVQEGGTMAWVISSGDEAVTGSLTLVFKDSPFRLVRWLLTDARDVTTRVDLQSIEAVSDFDDDFFAIQKHVPDRAPFGVR